jgi:hypothetical protein
MGLLRNEDSDVEIEVDLGDGKRMRGHPNAVNKFLASRAAARERNRRWPQTPEGQVDTRAAMTTLAHSFPSLREADGLNPWDLERFARWLCAGTGGGAKRAGHFVLHVWNAAADHREFGRELGIESAVAEECLRPFNLSDALGVWDEEHKRAFISWVEAPFWP